MFKPGFSESRTSTGYLSDDDPSIFSLFLEWVYGHHLTSVTAAAMALPNNSLFFMDRVKLYIFAEKICMDELCDYTITNLMSILQHYERSPTVQQMREACKGSAVGSPIRKFMCYNLLFHLKTEAEDSHWMSRALSDALVEVPDLCFDFMKLSREVSRVGCPKNMAKCGFHKHGEGVECGFRGIML
jgi:hypothetical protein